MRGQNFWVEWVEAPPDAGRFEHESAAESLLISFATPLSVQHANEARPVEAPARSVCVLPAGRCGISTRQAGGYAVVASDRPDLRGRRVLHEQAYACADTRIVPTGRPYAGRTMRDRVEVLGFDAIKASPDRPRLKMLQTETLSINLVEYSGTRDRTALSPHSHEQFEQGSLAMAGEFVHHLRVPWGRDANLWRDDEHLAARSPSLLVVPVGMVHTSEGMGSGMHLLVDVFSPPRQDFIDKGWVFNSGDYLLAS